MPKGLLNDETSVPMKWLIALLVGCASFTYDSHAGDGRRQRHDPVAKHEFRRRCARMDGELRREILNPGGIYG